MENADPTPPRTIVRRSPEEWEAVRLRLEAGETAKALAEELGVHVRTVQRHRGLAPKPGRKKPRSLTSAEEAEVCRLSMLGHYAKDLALQFDVCLATIRGTLKRLGARPCDRSEPRNLARSKRSNADAKKAVLETRKTAADRFVMDLPDGASFGEAARAAALSAVAHLKEASPTKCQQYLKSAQMLEAADQRASGGWGDPFADTPGRRAALDMLREAHGLPRAGEGDEGHPDPIDRRLAATGPSTAHRSPAATGPLHRFAVPLPIGDGEEKRFPSPSEDDGEETGASAVPLPRCTGDDQ